MQRSEGSLCGIQKLGHLGAIDDIGGDADCLAAVIIDALGGSGSGRSIDIADRHQGTGPRQILGDRLADTATGTGDNDRFTLKLPSHGCFFLLFSAWMRRFFKARAIRFSGRIARDRIRQWRRD